MSSGTSDEKLLSLGEHVRAHPTFWAGYALLVICGVLAFGAGIYDGMWLRDFLIFAQDPIFSVSVILSLIAMPIVIGCFARASWKETREVVLLITLCLSMIPLGAGLTILLR